MRFSTLPSLTAEEEADLAKRWAAGDRAALDHMVRANIRLVIRITANFSGLPREDLISAGLEGLTIACMKFDPAKGARLTTYLSTYVKGYILRAIEESSPVRIATTRIGKRLFWGWRNAAATIIAEGRAVTPAAVSKRLGLPVGEVEIRWAQLTGDNISLDGLISVGDKRAGSAIVAFDCQSPEDTVARTEEAIVQRRTLRRVLQMLPPRDRRIISGRYLRARPLTLEELGQREGISRERVRQIEQSAITKIARWAA